MIDYLRGKKEGRRFILYVLENAKCFITSINIAEIYSGKELEDPNKEFIVSNFLNNFTLLTLDKEVSKLAGIIRRKYNLPLADSFIAATALIYDLVLITRNIKHFSKIEGLKLLLPY